MKVKQEDRPSQTSKVNGSKRLLLKARLSNKINYFNAWSWVYSKEQGAFFSFGEFKHLLLPHNLLHQHEPFSADTVDRNKNKKKQAQRIYKWFP